MLKPKLQYFVHLMWTADSLEVPDAGKDGGQKEKRASEDEKPGWHHQCNGHELGKTLEWWWGTGKPGVLQSMGLQRVGHDWVTTEPYYFVFLCIIIEIGLEKYTGFQLNFLNVSVYFLWCKCQYMLNTIRVGHDWATSLSLFTFMHWRRKWQPTPWFLLGESQGRWSLVGCCLWGRTESDTTDVTQQQQQQHRPL